jgi:DNA-binding NarL/FixJ family response regulator
MADAAIAEFPMTDLPTPILPPSDKPASHGPSPQALPVVEPLRLVLIDDQTTIRQALKIMLECEPGFEVVGGAADGISGINLVKELRPDIVLVDIEMPGLDGIETTRLLTERCPWAKVLVLSGQDHPEYLTRAFQVGAKGYLLKNTPSEDLAAGIRAVHKGYSQISPGLLERMMVNGGQPNPYSSGPSARFPNAPSTHFAPQGIPAQAPDSPAEPDPLLVAFQRYSTLAEPVHRVLSLVKPRVETLVSRSRDLNNRLTYLNTLIETLR